MKVSIDAMGARNDGLYNNAVIIQTAIDLVTHSGGGKVVIPAGGTYLSGSIALKENVDLHLEAGAILRASSDYADYASEHNIKNLTNGEVDEFVLPQRAFIAAFKAHNARISGDGIIDGNADNFIAERGQYIHKMRGPVGGRDQYLERPFAIFMIECRNLTIRDITIKDPAFWAVRTTGCNELLIDGIRILTDLMVPNADGVDIDRCQNVRIVNCEFVTADDCISLKSCSQTSQYGDVANVIISNCIMTSTSGAITLGTESVGDIKNVLVTNCIVKDSHRGFAVRAREGGTISNVRFSNCLVQTRAFSEMWWGHGEALHVTAFSWDDPANGTDGNIERTYEGYVKDITFENISAVTEAGILNYAAHPKLIDGVTYRNVNVTVKKQSKWEPRIDLRPNGIEQVLHRKHNGFEVVNTSNLTIENCKLTWDGDSRTAYGEAIFEKGSKNFRKIGFVESTSVN
jgi:polygalacturonase